MKHLKTFEELNENLSAYDEVISEYPFLTDDSYYYANSFDEYILTNTVEDETDVHKISYDELLRLAHEWIALNYNILQNNANPSGE
jgi:hypothetical protein